MRSAILDLHRGVCTDWLDVWTCAAMPLRRSSPIERCGSSFPVSSRPTGERSLIRSVCAAPLPECSQCLTCSVLSCFLQQHMFRFLMGLRGLLRSSRSAALVTLPPHLCRDQVLLERLMWAADGVIELEGFGCGFDRSPWRNPRARC